MTKKKPVIVTGRINDVQIGEPAKGSSSTLRSVSALVQLNTDGRVTFEWFAVSKKLRSRFKKLVLGTDEVIGQDFELFVNENGQIEDFRRITK